MAESEHRAYVLTPGPSLKPHLLLRTRYLALRILAMDVQLDLRSLLRYLQFFQQMAFMDYDRAAAELYPSRYISNIRDFYGYAEVSRATHTRD